MKTLLLIRHAKSDWGDPGLDDIDRPLSERGKRDAPAMAHRLLDKKIKINGFISSPAKRATRTAKIFAATFRMNKDKIIIRGDDHIKKSFRAGQVKGFFKNDLIFLHSEGCGKDLCGAGRAFGRT